MLFIYILIFMEFFYISILNQIFVIVIVVEEVELNFYQIYF